MRLHRRSSGSANRPGPSPRRPAGPAVFVLVLAVLAVSLVVGKNILLNEVRKGIRKSFAYDRLKLSYFPPALVIENVRSLTDPPALRARRVRIEIPYLSLLRNRKILSVVLDSPEIHIRPPAAGAPRRKARPPLSILELPFVIERGLDRERRGRLRDGARRRSRPGASGPSSPRTARISPSGPRPSRAATRPRGGA